MEATTTTGQSAQTPAQAYKTAFDAMRAALEAIHHETMENPTDRPYSGDSYLPDHLLEQAQAALKLATELREPTPVKTQKTVTTRDAEFPYASTTETVRGAFVCADFFDVEPTSDPYSPVDNEAFLAMMRLIKAGSPKHRTLGRDTIISAAEKLSDSSKHPTRRWLAYGFFNLVDEFLRFAAHHADFENYVAKRIEDDKKAAAAFAEKDRERMIELTRRSVQARRARKAEKAGV